MGRLGTVDADWQIRLGARSYKNGRRGFATASGEVAKRDEERRNAYWLFFMGLQFELRARA